VYHYGTCERLSPEAPIPILKLNKTEARPGMCLNVAKNLEGLGITVDIITHEQLIKKHRYVEEKRMVHLLRVDDEQSKIDQIDITKVLSNIKIEDYDAVVISDYNKGFLPFSSCVELISALKHSLIFVDTKKQDLSCFENCIIKINKQERDNVKKLPKNLELIVTLGEHGASWRDVNYPTTKSKLYDVCGAGDTFLAGLVFEYLQTSNLEKAILFANKCASISINHFGTFILSKNDVR
jgi:D-beta-D-heptose 7-phosphate kinase/D-beta-D-heptose 1-phosphate adenosyltransferase